MPFQYFLKRQQTTIRQFTNVNANEQQLLLCQVVTAVTVAIPATVTTRTE